MSAQADLSLLHWEQSPNCCMPARLGQLVACVGLHLGILRFDSPIPAYSFISCQLQVKGLALSTGLPLRLSLPRKSLVRVTDYHDMTLVVRKPVFGVSDQV